MTHTHIPHRPARDLVLADRDTLDGPTPLELCLELLLSGGVVDLGGSDNRTTHMWTQTLPT